MNNKNLEHSTFVKIKQEVMNNLTEVGLPALFVNTLEDLEKLAQQNEYINQHIQLWIVGEFPNIDWPSVIFCNPSNDIALIEKGDLVNYDIILDHKTFPLSVCKLEYVQPGLITNVQPILTVVVMHKLSDEVQLETLRLLTDDLPWVYLIDFDNNLTNEFQKELNQKLLQFDFLTVTETTTLKNLEEIISQTTQERQSIHQNYLSLNQLKKTIKTVSLITKKEQSNIISKKAITQQKLSLIPDTRSHNANDLVQKIKQLIQQYTTSYEKSTTTNTELFVQVANQEGIKSILLDIQTNPVIFTETAKSKNIDLTINSSFEQDIRTDAYNRVLKKCRIDVKIFADTLHELEKEIEKQLDSQGVVFQRTNMKYLTQNEIDYFLNQCFGRDIEYSGTAPNKGLYEYFSAARKFQMVFFMMASVFGVSGLIRKYQYVSIPLSIVLLGYGIINVSKSVSKEREENTEKETKNAKDVIERWLKDVGSDLSRIWTKTLIDSFKLQLNTLNSETEMVLKSTLLQKTAELEDERKKQQKNLQTTELNERKLDGAQRNIQTMDRNILRVLTDSKNAFNQLLRAEREKPRDANSTSDRRSHRPERNFGD